nr:hypothetical protein [Bernardetia sp.]
MIIHKGDIISTIIINNPKGLVYKDSINFPLSKKRIARVEPQEGQGK